MSGERFSIDTNVLVYSVDREAGEKHLTAARVMSRAAQLDCVVTLQAISEFFVVLVRKGKLSRQAAVAVARDRLALFANATATASALDAALEIAMTGRASYWDALLIATAAEAGCTALITEDLFDGASFGPLRIVSPFNERGGLAVPARALLDLD